MSKAGTRLAMKNFSSSIAMTYSRQKLRDSTGCCVLATILKAVNALRGEDCARAVKEHMKKRKASGESVVSHGEALRKTGQSLS